MRAFEEIASGNFSQRIEVPNRDELGTLADNLNRMSEKLDRLYQQIETRNRDLSESLEQQTVTSEILQVIASSPTDIQPVLDVVAANAARLCDSQDAQIYRVEGDLVRKVASHGEYPCRPCGAERPVRSGAVPQSDGPFSTGRQSTFTTLRPSAKKTTRTFSTPSSWIFERSSPLRCSARASRSESF